MENQPPTPAPPVQRGEVPSSNDRLLAALGYPIWLVALIALLLEGPKDRPFTRYHAIQALGFNVAAVIFYFVAAFITTCLGSVTFIFWCLGSLLFFVPFFLSLYLAYRTYVTMDYFEIPVITDLIKQQGWIQK